jgi:myo-inositol-1(or 4)-monophosphatase
VDRDLARFLRNYKVLADYLEIAEEAARAGGSVLNAMQGRIRVRSKGRNDLVTEADLASQQTIREILLTRFPEHEFIGEESEDAVDRLNWTNPNSGQEASLRWIVDPLDGTTNYVHSLPNYAVSVALEQAGEILVGVVYDPVSGECYRAARGQGADLNGQRLEASDCRQASEALIAISFAPDVGRGSLDIERFLAILHTCQSIRRLGSAALNLCYVAAGRLDGYLTSCVKAWDVAAGLLIVREAGARITGIGGQPLDLRSPHLTCAATDELHAELLAILSQVE